MYQLYCVISKVLEGDDASVLMEMIETNDHFMMRAESQQLS